MICHRHGNEFFLITQHDHALLSGRIAERIGGGAIARPSREAIAGIGLHDCGWPLHDDEPTLNARSEPLHVFETSPEIAVKVWSASARRAANQNPYGGLLVSLHVLNLSMMAQASHREARDVFVLSKFQHAQIELQESLRLQLGLRIDLPLKGGLAAPGAGPKEDRLLFEFRLLRAMDVLSLSLLCSEDLPMKLDHILSGPGGSPVPLRLDRPSEFTVRLDPWPFETAALEFPVPFRRIATEPFSSLEAFRASYAAAPRETLIASILN